MFALLRNARSLLGHYYEIITVRPRGTLRDAGAGPLKCSPAVIELLLEYCSPGVGGLVASAVRIGAVQLFTDDNRIRESHVRERSAVVTWRLALGCGRASAQTAPSSCLLQGSSDGVKTRLK